VPSAIRFLTTVAVFGTAVYAAMFALATWVEPRQHEIMVSVAVHPKVTRPSPEAPTGRPRTKESGLDAARHGRLVTLFENMPFVR